MEELVEDSTAVNAPGRADAFNGPFGFTDGFIRNTLPVLMKRSRHRNISIYLLLSSVFTESGVIKTG
jgi:hypothetical protein